MRQPRWILIGAVLLLATAIGLRLGLKAKPVSTASDLPLTVSVVAPVPGDITAAVTLVGAISARNDMPISPEGDGGRIAQVLVEAGQQVRAGQLLAQIDPSVAQSQVAAAQASLEELRASADVADAEYKRAQKANGVFSVEESERRRTTALTAHAKVGAAEAQLAEMRSKLARMRIVAPTDGLVLTRTAEVGQVAVPGTTVLFRLARNGEIEMRGQVAEQDVPRLRIGQEAQVWLSGIDRPFAGKVWQVGAIIDPASREGSVRIALSSREADLRPGAFARAEIAVGATQGSIVPQTAVLTDEQGTYVLAVQADQKLERRAVTVGGAHRDGLLVTAGLKSGDRIVATAGAFLRPGEKVTVAGAAVAAAASSGT
ncbi:MAG: efflux RND transporter periplasmic adaptor subunit [Steroidobacteraceae bacterium]